MELLVLTIEEEALQLNHQCRHCHHHRHHHPPVYPFQERFQEWTNKPSTILVAINI